MVLQSPLYEHREQILALQSPVNTVQFIPNLFAPSSVHETRRYVSATYCAKHLLMDNSKLIKEMRTQHNEWSVGVHLNLLMFMSH